jgi:maltose alpha-D-glucosyltransferase/alpha-amylase
MPGTPVLYYGDEIGMGDNIYLGDRDGVRTPMQWLPDRNGGFSRADPARLFLPAVQDPIYGYDSVNVEAQLRNPSSLLNWLRRLLAVRNTSRAFGRGALSFIYPANRKVLAYVRDYEGDRILCVANLSRAPQAVELDLADFKGSTPVEMTGGASFPPIGELPYLLTLPAYGFYWFSLKAGPVEDRFGPPARELFTLVFQGHAESLVTGRERIALERNAAPGFLVAQRWFAGKSSRIRSVEMLDDAMLDRPARADNFPLVMLKVGLRDGSHQTYFVPLAIEPGHPEALVPFALAQVRRGPRVGLLYDAAASPAFAETMLAAMREGTALPTRRGATLRFAATAGLAAVLEAPDADLAPRRLTGEQSNTSIAFGDRMVMKLYRRLQEGIHPELEVGRFLTEVAGFVHTPALLGTLEHVAADGTPTALAILQQFVRNQGDAWTRVVEYLTREFETLALVPEADAPALEESFGVILRYAATLGRRTGELHLAFTTPTEDPTFTAEPFTAADREAAVVDAQRQAEAAFAALDRVQPAGEAAALVEQLRARRGEVDDMIASLGREALGGLKTRIHGDYHLGQVLIVEDDISIVDFEGEPSRPAAERRAKASPLRDVAGMLRSFAYAGAAAIRDVGLRLPEARPRMVAIAQEWGGLADTAFLDAYRVACGDSPVWIAEEAPRQALLKLFLLSKALYEIAYEANNRPDWIDTPVTGVLALMGDAENDAQ